MKILAFLFALLLSLHGNVQAAKYFDFELERMISHTDGKVNIQMFYDLVGYEEGEFLVRPIVEKGLVSIFNEEDDLWISMNEVWTEMPYLARELSLKVTGAYKVLVGLRVLNLVTNEIYETPLKEVWLTNSFGDYLQRLNANLTY